MGCGNITQIKNVEMEETNIENSIQINSDNNNHNEKKLRKSKRISSKVDLKRVKENYPRRKRSGYERKLANAKERERMKKLNSSFERLKQILPDIRSLSHEEKDTKVALLRGAVNYINFLKNLINDLNSDDASDALTSSINSTEYCINMNNTDSGENQDNHDKKSYKKSKTERSEEKCTPVILRRKDELSVDSDRLDFDFMGKTFPFEVDFQDDYPSKSLITFKIVELNEDMETFDKVTNEMEYEESECINFFEEGFSDAEIHCSMKEMIESIEKEDQHNMT